MLHEKSREQLKELIAELAAKKDNAPGSAAQKVGDLYNIAMDSVKLNKEGAASDQRRNGGYRCAQR